MSGSQRLEAYLHRIRYDGPVDADSDTLTGMHQAHWRTVPFENLSIQRGETIVTNPDANYSKIVERRRGGFCLELTGLFAWALREIGFQVDILGGRVLGPDGRLGQPLSHMTLLVHLDEPWIADVGFGGSISRPLRLNERSLQPDGSRVYTVANDGDHWLVACIGNNVFAGASAPSANQTYLFTLEPKTYEDFNEVCHWLQTSPESRFAQGDIVSLQSEQGRTTYARGRLIVNLEERREELDVSPAETKMVLRERFNLEI